MVAHIKKIAEQLVEACKSERPFAGSSEFLRALAEELDRLDPRDFLPDARFDFVMVRLQVRRWASTSTYSFSAARIFTEMAGKVLSLLDQYGGEGSRAVSRSFAFVKDNDLRQIIERDYRELRQKVFPSQAWKSTVVLAGSILEALLYDQLSTDPTIRASAIANPHAPNKDLLAGKWTLADLIEVSVDLGMLPKERAKTFDQILRDYRNFVHPKKELRAQHPCEEAEALMSVGALEGVCNILE